MRSQQSAGMSWRQWRLMALTCGIFLVGSAARAQVNYYSATSQPGSAPTEAPPKELVLPAPAPAALELPPVDTGCSSCGGGSGGCSSCGSGSCYPGRENCAACEGDTKLGRLCTGFFNCICCPDPCYEGHWLPVADSAFFVDAARPKTQMSFGYEGGWDFKNPDRAEYFWARERIKTQLGGTGKGPNLLADNLRYNELNLYMEAAADRFSAFINTPYERIDPSIDPSSKAAGGMTQGGKVGFGDITVGTKSMLLDCELTQLTFEFKTFIPSGNFTSGLGTGHVSLEPSLLYNLKCSQDTYIQGQLSYWIPLGGDSAYEGTIFHSHFSLNHTLCKPSTKMQLVGTLELNEWSVLNGFVTEPGPTPFAAPAHTTIVSMGPGLRLFICDKYDVGVGTAFAVTQDHWAEDVVRAQFRMRY